MAFQFCTLKKQLAPYNGFFCSDAAATRMSLNLKDICLKKGLKRCLNRKVQMRYPWKLLNSWPNISMRKVFVKLKGVPACREESITRCMSCCNLVKYIWEWGDEIIREGTQQMESCQLLSCKLK